VVAGELMNKMRKIKLAIISLHPSYYQDKIWCKVSENKLLDVEVVYLSDVGINKNIQHEGFGTSFCWDDLLSLEKYKHIFLKNYGINNAEGLMARVNPQLFNLVRKKKFDVVLTHGYSTFSSLFVIFAAKLAGARIIWRGESTLKGDENSASLKKRLKKIVLTKLFNACDAVMYSCTGNKNYLKFYGAHDSKLFPIPCAVDNDFYRSERKKYLGKEKEIKKELGIEADDFVIVFVARFTTRKRPLDLIEAIKKIEYENITVLFVGDGLERKNMEKFVWKHHIKALFTGFQNQTEISKYYSVSDMAVVISDYDPSPKAMNEAMNFELPIIVTDVVGTAYDLVVDGENGFVVKEGDVDKIAKRIDYLNKNRTVAKAMGKKSWEIVKDWNFQKDAKSVERAVKFVNNK